MSEAQEAPQDGPLGVPTSSSQQHLGPSSSNAQLRRLAVFGLSWSTPEQTVAQYFSQFGEVELAEVMKDRYTGSSRGFGFVTFVDIASAGLALRTPHMIDGRRCEIKGEAPPAQTSHIFVAWIHPQVTEADFRKHFEHPGRFHTRTPPHICTSRTPGPHTHTPPYLPFFVHDERRPLPTKPSTCPLRTRIPPQVTEAEFRKHFEQFGAFSDAYMPKDISIRVRGGRIFIPTKSRYL
eukprot:gene27242-2497_t